jgi:hypothetical protein
MPATLAAAELAPTRPRAGVDRRLDTRFFGAMWLAVAVAVFVGFAPTYYLKTYFAAAPLGPIVHLHGLVFSTWILLFGAQILLVGRRRVDLHRRLGVAGALVAGLVFLFGTTVAILSARRGMATDPAGAIAFLPIPLGDMLVFGVLVTAAIVYRRRPETHKRLMLLATLAMIDAAIARWPIGAMATVPSVFFGITDVFVAAGPVYDLATRRKVHAAYIWGGLLLVGSQPLRLALAETRIWQDFAGALLR